MRQEPAALDERHRLFGEAAAEAEDSDRSGRALSNGDRRPLEWRRSGRRLLSHLAVNLENEWERGAAFLLLPVLFGAGALLYFTLADEPRWALALGWPALALLVAVIARQMRFAHLLAAAVLTTGLGFAAAKVETMRAGTKMVGGEISTRITGRVVRIEDQASGRVRYTIDVSSTERPTLRYAPDRVRLTARRGEVRPVPGDVVTGVVRLRPPSGPVRPQSYDFAFESYFDRIGAIGFFLIGPDIVPASEPPSLGIRFAAAIEALRGRLAARIATAIGGAEGEIAAALVAGVRAGIPEDVNEALRRTGLAHVLSISGLHMALVAGTIMVSMRGGMALFPGFASRRPIKKYAAVAALLATAVYLFISGGAVAAQRSFIMIAVMLMAVCFDRAALTMRNLAISALIVLAIAPHEIVGPSFQMSFAATAALIAAYGAWARRRRKAPAAYRDHSTAMRVLRYVALYAFGLAATSIVAGAASGLYGAWHFQRVATLGLVANLAAMPFVSVLVMPAAVVAGLAMPFGLEAFPLHVMGQGIAAMLAIARYVAELPVADGVGSIDASAMLAWTLAFIIATVSTTWLRVLAIVPLAFGIGFAVVELRPDLYVSEDARHVGLVRGDGSIAVNRQRPSSFVLENWQRAAVAATVVTPTGEAGAADPLVFSCSEGLCTARTADGAIVATAETAQAATRACTSARLIVVTDATVRYPCAPGAAYVLTSRDLAWRGSAAIHLGAEGRDGLRVRHALPGLRRPWHDHRRFSREARGMPAWQPKPRAPAQQAPSDTGDISSGG